MQYSLAFHLVGIVLWLGGLIILPRIMSVMNNEGAQAAGLPRIVRRVWFGFIIPGLVITLLTGGLQLSLGGVDVYMKQGWFHGKLTFVMLLLAATVITGLEVSKANHKVALSPGKLHMAHGIAALSLILIVLLTMVGRH